MDIEIAPREWSMVVVAMQIAKAWRLISTTFVAAMLEGHYTLDGKRTGPIGAGPGERA